MKKVVGAMSVMILLTLLLSAWLPAGADPAKTYVKLLNPPKKGVLYLEVGESETFYIEVASEVGTLGGAGRSRGDRSGSAYRFSPSSRA